MAISRRQFVTRLGALAATVGLSQGELGKIAEAFAHNSASFGFKGDGTIKPQVIWVHGAECTGCSTSLLGLFENLGEKALAVPGDTRTLQTVVTGITGSSTTTGESTLVGTIVANPHGHTTLLSAGLKDGSLTTGNGAAGLDPGASVDIADVVIDFIDLQYHETIMGMGGDLAYQWLKNRIDNAALIGPFVLVVEGALQPRLADEVVANNAPYCSVGMDDAGTDELEPADIVALLAPAAKAIIPIGQCACYGGYPAAVSPARTSAWTWAQDGKQTTAVGVYDFLKDHELSDDYMKVINVPGCPTNPWWFVLTTVLWMYDLFQGPLAATPKDGPLGIIKNDATLSIDGNCLDAGNRLNLVYGASVHGTKCPRYKAFTGGDFAQNPGDPGCLFLLGCKGTTTNSLCSAHGWNGQQQGNVATWDAGVAGVTKDSWGNATGGFCPAGGAPCMGCTEKGYPDVDVPFVSFK